MGLHMITVNREKGKGKTTILLGAGEYEYVLTREEAIELANSLLKLTAK
jgi:hypothetical protein